MFINENGFRELKDNTKSEVIDLSPKGETRCFNWKDIKEIGTGATGGLIENTPVVCGGTVGFDRCFSLTAATKKL